MSTLETAEDTTGMESVDGDVSFTVKVELFLDTAYCADKRRFPCIVLDRHRTVDCAATAIRTYYVG